MFTRLFYGVISLWFRAKRNDLQAATVSMCFLSIIVFTTLIVVNGAYARNNEEMWLMCTDWHKAKQTISTSGGTFDSESLIIIFNTIQCSAFLHATRQSAIHDMLRTKICLPKETSIFQLASIYKNYIGGHAEL